jgi:F0F1-type ATP synthase membrane subunit b/b'
LAISFGPFYMLVRRLILPRAGKVFKERDIASDVADAIVVRFHW